jgi:ligand-binding sensor domain-containing protein
MVCLLLLISAPALWAKTYALPSPDPKQTTALATLIDADRIWVGYANVGLAEFDRYGQLLQLWTKKEGLPGNTVVDLVKRDKELWIATSDGLAVLGSARSIRTYTAQNGLPDNGITCLAVRDQDVFAGTLKGLAKFRGDTMDVFTEAHGLPAGHITALAPSPDALIIGTPKGWAQMVDRRIDVHTPQSDGLPFEWITSAVYFKYRKTNLSAQTNVSDDWIVLGTAGGGLLFYHDKAYTVLKKDDAGPGCDWITCLFHEPVTNTLWVGTQNGLAVEKIEDGTWQLFRQANGQLPSDFVKDISVHAVDEVYHDYEILLGRGDCPGEKAMRGFLASHTRQMVASHGAEMGLTDWMQPADAGAASSPMGATGNTGAAGSPGTTGNTGTAGSTGATGNTATASSGSGASSPGTAGSPTGADSPGTASASGSANASDTANASGTATASGSAELPCICKPPKPTSCPLCYQLPEVKYPKRLHIYNTWAVPGTMDGAALLHLKELPHYGQGHIYSYLSNKGWAVRGIGCGRNVYAGVYPAGAREGFLFEFVPPQIAFWAMAANPPETTFTTTINTLSTTAEGFPMVGAYSLGRGGLGILNLDADGSSLANPWQIFGSKEGLTDLNVTTIFREGATVLVGTGLLGKSGSVFRFRDGKFEAFPKAGLKHATLSSMFRAPVTCLWGDEQRVYVGTKDDGIYYFNGESWTRIDTFSHKTLSDDRIQALTYRDGVLYVGTIKGLDCFGADVTCHINVTEWGTYTNDVQYLLWDDSDGDGNKMVLWLGHKDGFSRISQPIGVMRHGGKGRCIGEGIMPWPGEPPSIQNVVVHSWPGNPKEERPDCCPFDGMPGNKILSMAYDDINLWIGTDNGLCRFRK